MIKGPRIFEKAWVSGLHSWHLCPFNQMS